MVIVKVMGGLGNQMFQYAFAKNIQLQYGYHVKLDFSYYDNIPVKDTIRVPYVKRLVSQDEVASAAECKMWEKSDRRICNRILKKLNIYKKHVLYEKEGIVDASNVMDDCQLIGYWQSERFFDLNRDAIAERFDFSQWNLSEESAKWEKIIKEDENAVSIHVRGGDYLLPENDRIFGGICTQTYYENAIEAVQKKMPDAKFYLFTNAVEWVKTHFILPWEKIRIVSDQAYAREDWEEMYLMSICKGNILANSSYSWWGAWLNRNENKLVVSPTYWSNDESNETTICDDWIKVSGES